MSPRDHPRLIAALAVVVFFALLAAGWFSAAPPGFEMKRHLAELAEAEGLWDNRYSRHLEKAADLETRLAGVTDPLDRIDLRRQIAEQQLLGGEIPAAISGFSGLLDDTQSRYPAYAELLRINLGLAWLRQGELSNCVWNPNAQACVFPLSGEGVHQARLGARQAAEVFAQIASDPKANPDNALQARWLFNIAKMALGEYPDGVPNPLLIPPETWVSAHDPGRFVDTAASRGANLFGLSGGAVMDDFDNDGDLDIVASSWGARDQLELLLNDGAGHFTSATAAADLSGITGGLNIRHADYDNDGFLDILVLRGAWLHQQGQWPNSLLRNNGDGSFSDVTAAAGILSHYPTQTAEFADFNNDGWLDLFVGNEIVRPAAPWPDAAQSFELYCNNQDGSFRPCSADSGIVLEGMIKGSAWGDIDNDGWTDLYVSIWGQPNRLFRNLGALDQPGRFEDVTERAGVAEPVASFPTWFWDFDNDGDLDLFVSGYQGGVAELAADHLGSEGRSRGESPRLYRNRGDGRFDEVAAEMGLDRMLLTMGSNFGDLDNDGWLDMYLGTGSPPLQALMPNRMFRNDRGLRFQDVTTAGGFGHLQKGHGVAFGDIDSDGDQDIYAVIGGAFGSDQFWNVLYENPGSKAHWVTLRLRGDKANRSALGARIKLRLAQADGSVRELHALVGGGSSFGGNSFQQELGLGTATRIDSIEIRWPGLAKPQRLQGPYPVDQIYLIREAADRAEVVGASGR